MLVLRSDLLTGFKNKLFKVDVNNVDHIEVSLDNDILICNLTSKTAKNGFKISGYILNNVLHNCDRCLDSFCINNKINAELFLTNSTKSLDKENNNTIYFSNQETSIDFKNILLEILLIEKPIKNLCTKSCKGLCTICGINLNHKTCTCSN